MDDFNVEVSCTEVVGIEPEEQALAQGFPLAVAAAALLSLRAGRCFPLVSVGWNSPSWQLLR